MAIKVKLFAITGEEDVPEYIRSLSANTSDSYAEFWIFLETKGLLDWSFYFWIAEDKQRVP